MHWNKFTYDICCCKCLDWHAIEVMFHIFHGKNQIWSLSTIFYTKLRALWVFDGNKITDFNLTTSKSRCMAKREVISFLPNTLQRKELWHQWELYFVRIGGSHMETAWEMLSHWGRVTHKYTASKLNIIGSDNGLSPGRHQAIIWTNAEILFIRTLGTNDSEILSEMHTFSFMKMQLEMSSVKWRPFCTAVRSQDTPFLFAENVVSWQ